MATNLQTGLASLIAPLNYLPIIPQKPIAAPPKEDEEKPQAETQNDVNKDTIVCFFISG